jgi:ribosomal protein L29
MTVSGKSTAATAARERSFEDISADLDKYEEELKAMRILMAVSGSGNSEEISVLLTLQSSVYREYLHFLEAT